MAFLMIVITFILLMIISRIAGGISRLLGARSR